MSELATRARKLHEGLEELLYGQPKESVALIGQALLAERRLAKLEDAEIALNERVEEIALSDAAYNMAIKHVVQALRAAAEKEVQR